MRGRLRDDGAGQEESKVMREYESIFVLDPEVEDSQVDVEVAKIRDIVTEGSGEILEVQKWGRRKLAYEVNKKKEGIYTLVRFKAGAEVLAELNRRFRLNESLLRHLTVLYEGPIGGDVESYRENAGSAGETTGSPTPAAGAPATGAAAGAPAAKPQAAAATPATAAPGAVPAPAPAAETPASAGAADAAPAPESGSAE